MTTIRTYWRNENGSITCDVHAEAWLKQSLDVTPGGLQLNDDVAALIGWTRMTERPVAEYGYAVRGDDGFPLPPCDTCRS